MDSKGGWVISKTNFSTGRCSLSKITTTTFSTSFCKHKNPCSRAMRRAQGEVGQGAG